MTTNYERIKNMSVDEMARFLHNYSFCSQNICKDCYVNKYHLKSICKLDGKMKIFYQWLNQEIEDEK